MIAPPAETALRQALREIVEGKNVKRGTHDLRWGQRNLVTSFRDILQESGYRGTTVKQAPVQPGERIPAFYLHGHTAHFGWIFWEKFTNRRMRKLFGSAARNAKGDWAIQISASRDDTVFANPTLRCDMDIDRPTSW